jgi:hypothetical protein
MQKIFQCTGGVTHVVGKSWSRADEMRKDLTSRYDQLNERVWMSEINIEAAYAIHTYYVL